MIKLLKDPIQDPRNPYYLHPSKNSSAILMAPPLSYSNYYNRSRSMKRALSSKNKFKFINSYLPQPSSSNPNFNLWERCNNMVISWITQTLSLSIYQNTICIDSAYDLLKDLEDQFTKGNPFRH